MFIHMNIYMCIYIYIYIYMYTHCTYIYIYIYTHKHLVPLSEPTRSEAGRWLSTSGSYFELTGCVCINYAYIYIYIYTYTYICITSILPAQIAQSAMSRRTRSSLEGYLPVSYLGGSDFWNRSSPRLNTITSYSISNDNNNNNNNDNDSGLTTGVTNPNATTRRNMGIHYRGVQWEGGAVDGGSII